MTAPELDRPALTTPGAPMTAAKRQLWPLVQVWRDVDHERRKFGAKVWWLGGEVSLGKRLYRARWSANDRIVEPSQFEQPGGAW